MSTWEVTLQLGLELLMALPQELGSGQKLKVVDKVKWSEEALRSWRLGHVARNEDTRAYRGVSSHLGLICHRKWCPCEDVQSDIIKDRLGSAPWCWGLGSYEAPSLTGGLMAEPGHKGPAVCLLGDPRGQEEKCLTQADPLDQWWA